MISEMREIVVSISNRNKNITPLETIDAVKAAGFRKVFVQWYNESWNISQERQLEYINSLGLDVIFAHLGYYKEVDCIWEDTEEGDTLTRKYITDLSKCAENGIPMVILHPVFKIPASACSETGLCRLQRLTAYAKECGIKIALENTQRKGCLEYILTNLKDDNLGVCFDSGHNHVYFNGDFNFQFFAGRIFAAHLHDNDKSRDQHLLPFDGTIDWEPVIRDLKRSGYSGHITLELCYRNKYLEIGPVAFYKKAYEQGEKLAEMFDRI